MKRSRPRRFPRPSSCPRLLANVAGILLKPSERLFPRARFRSSRGGNLSPSSYVRAAYEDLHEAPRRVVRCRAGPPEPSLAGSGRLYFDWSKTHLDAAWSPGSSPGEQAGLGPARDALFSGGIAKPSEGRAATMQRSAAAVPRRTSSWPPPVGSGCGHWSMPSRGCVRGRHRRPSHRHRRIGAWSRAVVDAWGGAARR